MNNSGKQSKSPALFNGISWGVTIVVVAVLVGFTVWKINPRQVSAAAEPPAPPCICRNTRISSLLAWTGYRSAGHRSSHRPKN